MQKRSVKINQKGGTLKNKKIQKGDYSNELILKIKSTFPSYMGFKFSLYYS